MTRTSYNKPVLSLDRKIELLKNRGLIINDEEKAKHYLLHIGYFRLTGYFKFFQNTTTNIFIEGVSFEQVIKLYNFDRKLRLLTLDAIEKIEVSLKSVMNYKMYSLHGSKWHLNENIYYLGNTKYREIYDKLLQKVGDIERFQSSIFIESYFKKYSESTIPCWMLFEELTIGEIATIYKILKGDKQREVAQYYDVDFIDLGTWMQLLRTLRNISAHHARLWNKEHNVKMKIHDKQLSKKFQLDPKHNQVQANYYNSVLVLNHMLQKIHQNFNWLDTLDALFAEFPNVPKSRMGFSENWRQDIET